MKRIIAALFLAFTLKPAFAADFLWLSDIHFDPLAEPALVDKLAAAEPADWAGILSAGANAKLSTYGADSNWALFSSVLANVRQTAPQAAFTIVTGDLLVHHFRRNFDKATAAQDDAAFRAFVRKSVEFVALQLKQASGNKPVFLALGNNDDECGDYAIQPDGPFLHDTAPTMASLAGLTETDSFVHNGSYNVANPSVKHQRILVLNTVFFAPRWKNSCGQDTADAGAALLDWLARQLETAQSHHEKVWLVYHIPPGVDAYGTTHPKTPGAVALLWSDAHRERFLALLKQYANVVGPNFAGHVHVDDFRLLGSAGKSAPFVIVAGAVSPITGQNPTYKTVTFDSHGRLKDQRTYYLKNLPESAQGQPPQWDLEYAFNNEWHVQGVNAANLSALYSRLGTDQAATARWLTLYSTSHVPDSLTIGPFRSYYCTESSLSTQAYQACAAAKDSPHVKTTN